MTKSNRNTRAGRYVNQINGYRAFIPMALPPDPPVRLEGKLQDLLSRADRALGRLDGSIQTLPNADLFVAMYIRKEAVLSSQIEGTQSSLQDVLAAEARLYSPGQPNDVDEVFNYVRAMNYGLKRLRDLPVSVRLIREIHTELLTGVRGQHLTPGELRVSQNWIGSAGCTLAEATFVPPPPHEVPTALGNLEQFLHGDTPLPLLIKIGLAHAQFETIHPFLDGNGRVGRLMITFLLCEKEVLLKPVLYLSHFFKHHRQEYYERLQAVRDQGAWEEWLVFFLESVFEVSQQATDTVRQILLLREQHRQVITDRFGRTSGNGHRVLEYLYRHPIISVREVKELTNVSSPAANNLVGKLTRYGILHELTNRKRNRRFIYRDYIRLFQDEA
uniref:Protein adenylyltransferase n=1 Tax=Candidatus Kentrum sp. FW TaxID=2126338 RepID=A0A450RZ73_9GAMM|nr:MAG: Fic family protein [Candidatus Kentron sp. FW]VFJ54231.1 MAG: Fic family protein [Candidatus Kentron sp. FW]